MACKVAIVAICLLIGTPFSASATGVLKGTVLDGHRAPVGKARVSVDGDLVQDIADDKGSFRLSVPPLEIGNPSVFSVDGWVVIDPCIREPGRTYIPDPARELHFQLSVLRKGDVRILDASFLGCLVEKHSSRFPAKHSSASVLGDPLANPKNKRLALQHVRARLGFVSLSAVPTQETPEDYWRQESVSLGFTEDELRAALDKWGQSIFTDSYQAGLAALYRGDPRVASEKISYSIDSDPGSPADRLVVLARAYYEQGNYEKAGFALERFLKVHPTDSVAQEDLAITRDLERERSDVAHERDMREQDAKAADNARRNEFFLGPDYVYVMPLSQDKTGLIEFGILHHGRASLTDVELTFESAEGGALLRRQIQRTSLKENNWFLATGSTKETIHWKPSDSKRLQHYTITYRSRESGDVREELWMIPSNTPGKSVPWNLAIKVQESAGRLFLSCKDLQLADLVPSDRDDPTPRECFDMFADTP